MYKTAKHRERRGSFDFAMTDYIVDTYFGQLDFVRTEYTVMKWVTPSELLALIQEENRGEVGGVQERFLLLKVCCRRIGDSYIVVTSVAQGLYEKE